MYHVRIVRSFLAGSIALLSAGIAGCWETQEVGSSRFTPVAPSREQTAPRLDVLQLGGGETNAAALRAISRGTESLGDTQTRSGNLLRVDCGILAVHANSAESAARLLDEAILVSDSITRASDQEKEVTSRYGREAAKTFKGEPYEKVLLYLYRGLVYLSSQDYENAHACFLRASILDLASDDADQNQRAEWMSVDALLLLTKRLMNSTSTPKVIQQTQQRYAEEHDTWIHFLMDHGRKPVIVFLASGQGPVKTTRQGAEGVALSYQRRGTKIDRWVLRSGRFTSRVVPVDDVYIQAATAGKRKMDNVLQDKAQTGQRTDDIGKAVGTAGILVGQVIPGVNIICAVIADAAMKDSHSIDGSADVRSLLSAPDQIHLAIVDGKLVGETIQIQAYDAQGNVVGSKTVTLKPHRARSGPTVIVGRTPF